MLTILVVEVAATYTGYVSASVVVFLFVSIAVIVAVCFLPLVVFLVAGTSGLVLYNKTLNDRSLSQIHGDLLSFSIYFDFVSGNIT